MGRKRAVSKQDADLFRDAVDSVRAIDDDRAPVYRRSRIAHTRTHSGDDSRPHDEGSQADAAGERDPAQLFVRPVLQHKHLRRLRRGQIPIEAEADLHGMRTREAEKVLASFLRECRDEGLRCVRVIHGKGRGSRGGQAVLKWEVDRWLRRDEGVMAFSSAQPRDGGTGAVYVLLKR